ncbi:Ig-like domain-containing protein [Cohnella sp. GCM10012308]|uniref:Ig-like domain-containing protein n=1 Tax=Cohnella sp. GCM10012308 TaxID=3317329 RepID=UPI00360A10EF
MLLCGGVLAIGPGPIYAADRTVATWNELTDAFANAPSGDTIVLGDHITQTSGTIALPPGKSLTLNLKGYTLSITAPAASDQAAIGVIAGTTLTIVDTLGGGTLNATGGTGGYGAGIGSAYQKAAGTIMINGGTINAMGASNGSSGIGGGANGAGGTVTVNGGTVNATGRNGGSGIGGGLQGAGGTVTITGGTVNATGNNGGAGIGGGYGAPGAAVTITGGVVTPSTGNSSGFSAIGPGSTNSTFGSLSNSGTIVIPSGQRLVIPAGITFENSGTIEGTGSLSGAGTIQNTGTISSPVTGVTVSGNAYDLSFNLNGAPGTPPASLHVLASTVQAAGLSLTSPSPSGYEFDGWYTLDGVPFTDTTPISSITNTSSATLYAHWKAVKIVSVASLSDIRVPYGTMQSGLGLPGTVNVSLSNGTAKPAAVSWDGGAPAYDRTKPGTYVFTGTLTAPAGSVNPDGKTASVNVVVELPTVSTVGTLMDMHVPYGTTLGAAGLPATVSVTLSSGETKSATVTWNGGTPAYDGTKPGTYAFVGTVTAPTGSTNPGGKTASVNVVVELPTVSTVGTLTDIHVPYGTTLGAAGLPTAVSVTLSSGDAKSATVTWNGGTPAYDGTKPGTYAFVGTVTAPTGSTNPGGKTASVNVVVELPTVSTVGTLTDIHVPYGTTLGAAGLPTAVSVTLSSGDAKSATVTWNGGTPAYDGTKPGTYAFVGTLTAPAGSTNPNGKTASINVIVELPIVSSVGTLADIRVPYGTKLEDAGLPAAVDVKLSSGDIKSATVTWNGGTPSYDGTKPGTYAFVGTLMAPTGSTNPDGKTASVNIIVALPIVSTVGTLTDIRVPYGTKLEDAGLPATVDVTLSSGETKSATVTWNGGTPTYDGTKPGMYTFVGTLMAPTGSTNPDGKTASVNIIVALPIVSTVGTLTDIRVPYGTKLEDAGLPATVDVTLSSGESKSASVTWNGGTPAYDGTKPGTYTFVGTLTAPTGSTNLNDKTASINVIVELPIVSSVGTLADIPVPYGTKLEDAGLSAAVDVTLSSGDIKSATVTWNGGTPSYDGTKPGTYAFVGTLMAPTGSTNPDGKTASVNIIVALPIVSSVGTLADIRVPFGTKLEDAGLPATVDVTLSSGETKSATVTWNGGTPSYDGTKPGTYAFVGTLTAPTGSTNPDGKTVSVNIIVELPTLSTVGTLADIRVPYGTKLEDAGLPATVDVTLSSGESKSATVTWNGGTPSYDGTKPGTYAFVGTLTAPTGSTNPDGKTVSVNIIVALPIVSSVGTLADIRVPYGTKLEDAGLPATVEVTLSSGDTNSAMVTWNGGTQSYDGTKPGTYAFVGTLTAPTGSTNPGDKTASVNIIVALPTVSSVGTLADIRVPYGTKLEDAGLPATVDVTLSSGETKSATVTWNGGTPTYDGTKPGTYTFVGTLTAPTGSTNPDGKTASINVIVELPTVSSVGTLADIRVPYGTKLEDAGLPATVDVTLSSGETKSAMVSWNDGTPAYNGTKPGTYTFVGTLTAPTGSTNPDGKTVSVNIIVALPTVSSVGTFADIRVPYGTKLEDAGLPATVEVTLSNGETKPATVMWNGGTPAYDGKTPGAYTFVGTLTAPTGSTNPEGMKAIIRVQVDFAPIPTPSDPSRMVVNCGIGVCAASIGDKGNVSVTVHAASRPFSLTLERLDANELRLPGDAQALSMVFRLSKNIDETLQLQMSLQIKLDSATIGEGRRAALFAYDEAASQWTEMDGSLNGDVFSAQTSRFAAFAVLSVAEQTTQPEKPAIQLSDVTGHWAKTEIEAAVGKGILTGYQDGTFRPNQQVSRVEFTVMLSRALKLSNGAAESAEPTTFADAAGIPAWARSSVAEATAHGLIQGFADGTFRPGALMSRAELAAIAARALQLPQTSETALSFVDANDIPAWAKAAVASAQQARLMKGQEGNQFAPLASVTRAEAAVLIMRMIERL